METVEFTFRCVNCGGDSFAVEENPSPESHVTCRGCGAFTTFEKFNASRIDQSTDALQDAVDDLVEDMFRDFPGATVTR